MGAETFSQVAHGKTAQDAFNTAQEQARYDYGHAGYTGTIAEKCDFIMLKVSPEKLEELKAKPYCYYDYSGDDPLWEKVDDKWGPAGCIDLQDGRYLFFGWASS
jgi:hypothetical protein